MVLLPKMWQNNIVKCLLSILLDYFTERRIRVGKVAFCVKTKYSHSQLSTGCNIFLYNSSKERNRNDKNNKSTSKNNAVLFKETKEGIVRIK